MAEETATVQVAEGALRGRRVQSRAGGAFWSFQGVPYARPPLGPLRFKDAQPAEPWTGARDAFKEGDNCRHFNKELNEYVGSEDCLYLNVYTPRLPREGAAPLPVMVFIHGGGFEYGSADSDLYGADYLVAEDVLLVTINYRLGPLGFLRLGSEAPGNAGLKDQVAALRWVQRNIAAFGGDAGNVTLLGMSAGGTSVHLHMLSPMSQGLFHRAVAMSGAGLNPWALQTEPEETGRRLARALGCADGDGDDDALVRFLRGVDHQALVHAARTDAMPPQDKLRLMTFTCVTTPEKVVPGVETFLPAPIEQLMKEGRHHAVPFMTGLDENEALLILAFTDFRKPETAQKVDSKWEENILPETRLPQDGPKNAAALEELRQFFMGGKPLSKDTMNGYMDMLSDLTFFEGIAYALRCMAKSAKAPLHLYIFTIDDELNVLKKLKKIDEPGACHGDDLGYLFRAPFLDPDLPPDSSAALARRRMVQLYTNYAKTGDPTPNDDPLLGVRWKPYTENERYYLDIGAELKLGKDLFADRVAFWEKFYEKYGS